MRRILNSERLKLAVYIDRCLICDKMQNAIFGIALAAVREMPFQNGSVLLPQRVFYIFVCYDFHLSGQRYAVAAVVKRHTRLSIVLKMPNFRTACAGGKPKLSNPRRPQRHEHANARVPLFRHRGNGTYVALRQKPRGSFDQLRIHTIFSELYFIIFARNWQTKNLYAGVRKIASRRTSAPSYAAARYSTEMRKFCERLTFSRKIWYIDCATHSNRFQREYYR